MVMAAEPGAQSIDTAYTGAYIEHLGDLWSRRDMLVEKHGDHKARVRTATNVANGEWYVEWPDLTQTPEAPTVANIVEMGIHHWSAVGGAVLPSIRVPVNLTQERTQARRGARKRERRLRELWKDSNMAALASLWWGDYAGAGTAIVGAWVDFSLPKEERRPFAVRFDPRHTYTLRDERNNVTELLVARKRSKLELSVEFPEAAAVFDSSPEEAIEEWVWYKRDRLIHAFVDISKDGRTKNRNYFLANVENPLGFVPAYEIVLTSFDGQRRGVFDQTIHILRTMHRLMMLTIYSTEEHAFPAVAGYDVANLEEWGPGALLEYRSPEGRIDRIGPTQHFDVKDLIARLTEEARSQSAFPQQLTGEPGASIVSARGINASMGQLDARLAVAHRQFEIGFGKLCGFLLALDEKFCDYETEIVGDHRDAHAKSESWLPSRDVNGAWDAECTYGLAAGSDPANMEVRLSMHLANGGVSQETYRQQLPFLEDPDREKVLIFREQMQTALVTGILSAAEAGDTSKAAEALKLVKKDDADFDEIMEQLVEALAAPPTPEAGVAGGGMEAIMGAESLARGGVPGSAEMAPPAMGLPPLSSVMDMDSRQIS